MTNHAGIGGETVAGSALTRRRFLAGAVAASAFAAQLPFVGTASARPPAYSSANRGFVGTRKTEFTLGGNNFYFGGTNNYYLHYKSRSMADDVLEDAAAMGLKVVRTWGWINGEPSDGYVMQPEPYVYDEDGFELFDYSVWRAKRLGLKLVVPFVDNWEAFGGMDQYVEWFGGSDHDEFYTDPKIKACFKAYVRHFLNRKNRFTGVRYRHERAIMAWEPANEPRCRSDRSGDTLVGWVSEMTSYIKRLAPRHLVTVGDEGFYNRPETGDYGYDGSEGTDWDRFIRLPSVDYGTMHLYPDAWGKDFGWSVKWIQDHIRDARAVGKPVVLEEFGWKNPGDRDEVYRAWTETVYREGGSGDQVWILTGEQDDGSLYPDYDGFRVVYPSETADLLAAHAAKMNAKSGTAVKAP